MRIEFDIKLNFSDVLIKPIPTSLNSRKEVNIYVSYRCLHSKKVLHGFPVIVANMSCVGTITMAKTLYNSKTFVALHKFIKIEELINFLQSPESTFSFISFGITNEDLEKMKIIKKQVEIKNICLDVANGYMYSFLERIKLVRDLFPETIIMAGNVCEPKGTENIIKSGADIVKCGISNGCFIKGTKIKTKSGVKKIELVCPGDEVLTHKGNYKQVIETHNRLENQRIIEINGIKCTPNHKFYVLHKKHKDIVNNNNLEIYAKWVSAGDINDNYFLIKVTN